MSNDPTITNPDQYRTLWENDFVRVLEYTDVPGTTTTPHTHPNSVMVTLSSFRRRLMTPDRSVEVALDAGQAVWIAAQEHAGSNIGDTDTHTILVELKGAAAGSMTPGVVGPEVAQPRP